MATSILSREIKAYRKGETLPTKLNRQEIISLLQAMPIAVENGMPEIGTKNLGDKILLEGRGDAGTNEFNYKNKDAGKLYNIVSKAMPEGAKFRDLGATYAAAILDKSQVAERLNIPFELAWNGTGKRADADGKRHASRAEVMKGAIDDPRNAELKDLIDRGIKGNLTQQEKDLNTDADLVYKNLGIERVVSEGLFTREASNAVSEKVYNTVTKDLKLKGARAHAVFEDLKDPYEILRMMPSLWAQSKKVNLGYSDTPALAKYTPDSIEVLQKVIGIDLYGN